MGTEHHASVGGPVTTGGSSRRQAYSQEVLHLVLHFFGMPTKKHRYIITGDDRVESALRRGRRRFPPGTPDSRILVALVSKGDEALEREAESDSEQRRRAAAERLAERFQRPDGLDYTALGEASGRWLRD